MRLIAFTIELGDAPTSAQVAAVAEAAESPSTSVVAIANGTTIIGPPEAVTASTVAAAHVAKAVGAQIRCRVEPLGEATTECAQEVAANVRKGVAAPPPPPPAAETPLSEAPTLDGTTSVPSAPAVAGDPLLCSQPLLDAISASDPTPAGGSATAAVAAMAAAIVTMAARVTLGDERYSDVHADMMETLAKSQMLRDELHALVRKDADVYSGYLAASAMPQETEAEEAARTAALPAAAMAACEAPLDVMRRGLAVLELCSRVARRGSRNTRPDVAVAATLAGAATRGAWINVRVNLPLLRDLESRSQLSGEAGTIARQAEETERHTLRATEVDAR